MIFEDFVEGARFRAPVLVVLAVLFVPVVICSYAA